MSRPSLAILCLAALTLAAQTPTIDQSLSMKQVAGVEVSPNGRYVAYVVQQANWEENSFDTQIWIHDVSAGENYQLTSGKKSSQSPKWSPDSRRLAFASERDNKRQIYVISPRGGEAAQLTSEDNGVGSFDWSPDGAKIAFLGSGPDSKSKKDRKDKYGDFEVIGGDYTMQHIWVVPVPQEIPADAKQRPKPEALTKGDQFSVSDFQWSPQSRLVARRTADRVRHLQCSGVLLLRRHTNRGRARVRGQAAHPERDVRRRSATARMGRPGHLLPSAAEDQRAPVPARSGIAARGARQRAGAISDRWRFVQQGPPHDRLYRLRAEQVLGAVHLIRRHFSAQAVDGPERSVEAVPARHPRGHPVEIKGRNADRRRADQAGGLRSV